MIESNSLTTVYRKPVSGELLGAFHLACDLADYAVADALLKTFEWMHTRGGPQSKRRREIEGFVAAHERLWHLRRFHTQPQTTLAPAAAQ
jgi:hypothetical protein